MVYLYTYQYGNCYHTLVPYGTQTYWNHTIVLPNNCYSLFPPLLKVRIEQVIKTCGQSLRAKLPDTGYSKLPPWEATLVPWYGVAVNLVGPWSLLVHRQEITFDALTCIHADPNRVELVQIENTWLARYPKPARCGHDNGGTFIGPDFIQFWLFQLWLRIRNPMQSVNECIRHQAILYVH